MPVLEEEDFFKFKLDKNGSLTASQIKGIRAVPLLTLVSKIQPIRFIHESLKRLNCHFKHAETKKDTLTSINALLRKCHPIG